MPGPRIRSRFGPGVENPGAHRNSEGPTLRPRESAWRSLAGDPSQRRSSVRPLEEAPSTYRTQRQVSEFARRLMNAEIEPENDREAGVRNRARIAEILEAADQELRLAGPHLTAREREREIESILRFLKAAKQVGASYSSSPHSIDLFGDHSVFPRRSPWSEALQIQVGHPFNWNAKFDFCATLSACPSFTFFCLPPLQLEWTKVWIAVHQAMLQAEAERARETAKQEERRAEITRDEVKRQTVRDIERGRIRGSEDVKRQVRSSALLTEVLLHEILLQLGGLLHARDVRDQGTYGRAIEEERRVRTFYPFMPSGLSSAA